MLVGSSQSLWRTPDNVSRVDTPTVYMSDVFVGSASTGIRAPAGVTWEPTVVERQSRDDGFLDKYRRLNITSYRARAI